MTDKETIAFQAKEISSLKKEISSLKEKLTVALARIEHLSIKKTSSNSSMPPSHDIEKTKSLRRKSKRSSGGQPGHKGSSLKMAASPDVVEELKPVFCHHCGQALQQQALSLRARRQVIDIAPVQPIVTEHRQYQGRCHGCGATTYSAFPLDVNAPITVRQAPGNFSRLSFSEPVGALSKDDSLFS